MITMEPFVPTYPTALTVPVPPPDPLTREEKLANRLHAMANDLRDGRLAAYQIVLLEGALHFLEDT